MERAGMFTAWISSCLSCVWPEDEHAAHQRAMNNKGIEREMAVCHSQPHLVPPMKLVVYDDLPSPGPPPRSSSLPSWLTEGRSLASRASNRASMSLRRKSTTRLTIGAPTDFRRVQPPSSRVDGFRPLELSIYMPGSRLSDLPEFDEFQLDDNGQPTLPSRAVTPTPTMERSFSKFQNSSFQFARKPVGSGSRRSSVATMDLLLDLRRPSATADPLIPHFALRTPRPSLDVSEEPRPCQKPQLATASGDTIPRKKNAPAPLSNRPLPPTPADPETLVDSPLPASPTSLSSHSGRIREWLSQPHGPVSTPPSSPRKPTSYAPSPQYSRSRTLSASTISSTTIATPRHATSASLSSGTTAATTTAQISTIDGLTEKEILTSPFTPKQMGVTTARIDESPYPTIHEGGHEYGTRFRDSVVGLAF
ncbi:hypothetical protein DTO164E3_280 [Paecilomyces variotii]|nr:hypothetical protein DTO032I3_3000 [Paecilomyces variotii]KAJ9207994.1 hypothetical protein DTO164E3_280 [Paecilomyces variotii]KAJ9280594.1 hypothetical protein DTO021D3_2444 [Paecilomyces variotii]KAJ9292322.1 hypothetical protein DTO021C3_215 [Paecilomyces variotii]KAJ9323106.1 hypothetical protein DTO027B3_5900 [Paecilomyces variotii]